MAVRRKSTSPKLKFNESWTAVARAKAKLRRNARKKIAARFFLACSQVKRSAHPSRFWCTTKTLGRRITLRLRENFDHHMPISLMRPSMEFGTGRVVAARRRAKRSDEVRRGEVRKK